MDNAARRRKIRKIWCIGLCSIAIVCSGTIIYAFSVAQLFVMRSGTCTDNGAPCQVAVRIRSNDTLVVGRFDALYIVAGDKVRAINPEDILRLGAVIFVAKEAPGFRMDGTWSHGDRFDAHLQRSVSGLKFDAPMVTDGTVLRQPIDVKW
jgi:hypothetical protein